jgi:hypothetical protein
VSPSTLYSWSSTVRRRYLWISAFAQASSCLPIFVFFTSAKTSWKKIVSSYFDRTQRKTIRKMDHPNLLKRLFEGAFTPRQVVAGFARSGIWPFDRNAMKEKATQPVSTQSSRSVVASILARCESNSRLSPSPLTCFVTPTWRSLQRKQLEPLSILIVLLLRCLLRTMWEPHRFRPQ